MVFENNDFKTNNGVDFREGNNRELPSVSRYGELECNAAHNALVEASEALLPLADYIEHSFSPECMNNTSNVQQINGHLEER